MHSISRPVPPSPSESLSLLLRQWGMAPARPAPASARLGAWLGWADAIEIAQLLTAPPGKAVSEASRTQAQRWAQAELALLREQLVSGFHHAELASASGAAAPAAEESPLMALLAPYMQHLSQQQLGIASRVALFRDQLRARLADASEPLARLAQLDEYIGRALIAPERGATTSLGALLEQRARMHHAVDAQRWRPRLWADLQRLLRAELDHKLQPVLGLIEALGTLGHE